MILCSNSLVDRFFSLPVNEEERMALWAAAAAQQQQQQQQQRASRSESMDSDWYGEEDSDEAREGTSSSLAASIWKYTHSSVCIFIARRSLIRSLIDALLGWRRI